MDEVITRLVALENLDNAAGMVRFGIRPQTRLLGISVTELRKIARDYKRNHDLALVLWNSAIHEARILASMVDDRDAVTPEQMNVWAADFDSWDICDQTCQNLFRHTSFVIEKSGEWMADDREFVKRAGFVLVAELAVGRTIDVDHRRTFLPELMSGMTDDRNFVKKAVSWSFRQIGKSDEALRGEVIEMMTPLATDENRTKRWIAKDVIKDLRPRK